MAIEIFNRYENKYKVDQDTMRLLQERLYPYVKLDTNNQDGKTYSITNLYYDTANSDLIKTSLNKPRYKEKLRIRAYGVPQCQDRVYVEIKKKWSGLVNKRRSAMKLDEAYEFLQHQVCIDVQPYMNCQVLSEVEYLLQKWQLQPALYLSYERIAYFGKQEDDLRISFDTQLTSRRTNLRLEAGNYGQSLLPEACWLMEIKVANSMPVWLTRLLAELKIYPISFSKYGVEYQHHLQLLNSVNTLAFPQVQHPLNTGGMIDA